MGGERSALQTPSPAAPKARHIYNQYVIRVPDAQRDALRESLKSRSIGSEIYYPLGLHQQECFADLGYRRGQFPVAEQACNEVLALPIYPELAEDQQRRVVEAIASYY